MCVRETICVCSCVCVCVVVLSSLCLCVGVNWSVGAFLCGHMCAFCC